MKIKFLIGLLVLLPLTIAASEKSPWETKFPFKSASIHYTVSGMENGSQDVYIRNYGREVAAYLSAKSSMMGITMVKESVEIDTPEWLYQFDLAKGTGTKSTNPEKYMNEEYYKLSNAEKKRVRENGEKTGLNIAEGFGGKIKQNAKKILGYDCDLVEVMGTVTYTIHGTDIPLLVESNMMGMKIKIEATSIKKGKVANKFFELPKGIKIEFDPQSDVMAREVAKQTIAGLKDPGNVKKQEGIQEMQGMKQQMTAEEQQQMKQAMEMMKGMFGSKPQ